MRSLRYILLLAAALTPATASAAPQAPPMTEPPPRMVVQQAGQMRQDHTARPPSMGQSTHAIMMPGQDMPQPTRAPGSAPLQGSLKRPS